MNLSHLAQRLFNTPLILHPGRAEGVLALITNRFGISHPRSHASSGAEEKRFFRSTAEADPGYDMAEGIAIISVQGILVQKLGSLRPRWGMSGYDGIRQGFLTALCDPDVAGICLDIDSPGGEVAGCFDLVDDIYASRGVKPVHAILTENAFSAAYAIASAADRIHVPRTGSVGSVGVIMIHCDWSQRIKDEGLAFTLITYGDRKAEGNAYTRLTEQACTAMQDDVDALGRLFIRTVSRNRGITEDAVRQTQAGCFLAAEGVRIGLADAVMSPGEAFQILIDESGG